MLRRLLLVTGLAALLGYFLRRQPYVEGRLDAYVDPAEELRRKLDEARSRDESPEPELSDDLDARRRAVHERGRASADGMRGSTSE